MRKIYIVLTYTGTLLAKIVKLYTKKEYSHVSISLDRKLNHMYSFGRINSYIPFIGGFVKESPYFGTFKRFKKTKTIIYSMEVNEEQFQNVINLINEFNNNKKSYRFNVLGLIGVMIHCKVKREKYFYCAEFVKYVLEESKLEVNLPDIIKPEDFRNLNGINVIYKGVLKEYN